MMCDSRHHWTAPDSVEILCTRSGKPITVTNQYGTFCEDLCDLEECKEAALRGERLLKLMNSLRR